MERNQLLAARILIAGHGIAGRALAADIRARGGTVVGFIDDRSESHEVLGTLDDVNEVLRVTGATTICLAIPSIPADRLRAFLSSITVDVAIDILPRTYDTLSRETVRVEDLTDVDVLNLIGREPAKHDLFRSRALVEDRVVLVTGAAGSIGSQLIRQLTALRPRRVIGVDRWENGLFFLGQELESRSVLHLEVGDIQDAAGIDALFARHRPDIVFHAAAYKHVPLMQANPLEAINNNVWGTMNVMRAAVGAGVTNVVYVSTDKAVNPVNVMGATKRLGEMVVGNLAHTTSTRLNVVRFGNVIESNGSVMQIFRRQLAERKPLTVTHPDVTRFFMTVDEAAQLIIQSAIVGESGDTFVLDMGEPVKIMDLARSLVRIIDPGLQIETIGLRPGEKMFEELSYEPEKVAPTSNPHIFVTNDGSDDSFRGHITAIERLAHQSRRHVITPEAAVEQLRNFGFEIR